MQIPYENILLRDMIETDIEDYVRWNTVEREWQDWDAPWENEDTNEENERAAWRKYYMSVKDRPDGVLRQRLEIELDGRHIGWVSSYCIDENYDWIPKVKENQTVFRAVGISIGASDLHGKGIGTSALYAFIQYFFANGVNEIYTQTWSGNVRMLRCAQKLGFVECDRRIGEREVRGKRYDGLTFRLKKK